MQKIFTPDTDPPPAPERLDAPRLRLLDERGPIKIYEVDGAAIRRDTDKEFTNFSHHEINNYVPENEFWHDRGHLPNEIDLNIEHMLVEHRRMKDGDSYEDASAAGARAVRRERVRRFGKIHPLGPLAEKTNADDAHKELLRQIGDLAVWKVHGAKVRIFDPTFTAGGHDEVYGYVPTNEIWIDDATTADDEPYVACHELHERRRMHDDGLTYPVAHREASSLEQRLRNDGPDALREALEEEGWK